MSSLSIVLLRVTDGLEEQVKKILADQVITNEEITDLEDRFIGKNNISEADRDLIRKYFDINLNDGNDYDYSRQNNRPKTDTQFRGDSKIHLGDILRKPSEDKCILLLGTSSVGVIYGISVVGFKLLGKSPHPVAVGLGILGTAAMTKRSTQYMINMCHNDTTQINPFRISLHNPIKF